MNTTELAELLGECFAERGLEPEHGRALGEFCAELAREQSRALLVQFLDRLSTTRTGSALGIALNNGDTVSAAARRLRCSKGSLHKLVIEFEEALGADTRTGTLGCGE